MGVCSSSRHHSAADAVIPSSIAPITPEEGDQLKLRAREVAAQQQLKRRQLLPTEDDLRNNPEQQADWQLALGRLHAWIRRQAEAGILKAGWFEKVPYKNRQAFELLVKREPPLVGQKIHFEVRDRECTKHTLREYHLRYAWVVADDPPRL